MPRAGSAVVDDSLVLCLGGSPSSVPIALAEPICADPIRQSGHLLESDAAGALETRLGKTTFVAYYVAAC